MRKLLFILVGLAIAACAFGQQMTWINPNWPLSSSGVGLLPKSMLGDLTYGLFYDEVDTLFLAPAELSKYSGIGLFTAYSNFDFYWNAGNGPAGGATNPFDPASGINYGRYLAGVTLPIGKYRGGAFAGVDLNQTARLDPTDTGGYTSTTFDYSRNDAIDTAGGANGIVDYTTALTESAIGTRMTNQVSAVTGVDLGSIGASVLFNWQSDTDTIGGTMNYTFTQGTDAAYVAPANIITNYWGLLGKADAANPGPSGNATTFVRQANQWVVAALGEIPWKFPITAGLAVGGGQNGNVIYNYPVTRIWTINNAVGTGEAREGYTIGGLAVSPASTYAYLVTNQPVDGSALDVTGLTLPAVAASDPANFNDMDLFGRLGGYVDPVITLSSNITLKTRGGITYTVDLKSQNDATIRAVHYTNTQGGTGSFTQTETVSAPSTGLTHLFDLDLGGAFEFTESTKFLVADVGLFYIPTFSFQSTALGNEVTTTTTTYTETAPSIPDATGNQTPGPATVLGTRVDTTTTPHTGADGRTTLTNLFVLPVAVKLNIVQDKLQLIGAYQLSYTYEPTILWNNENPAPVAATVSTVTSQAGANVYTSPAPVSAATAAITTSRTTIFHSTWGGTPNFMVRWMPLPQLTLDFWGNAIITDLAWNIFTDPWANVITNLGVNVSFRF